MNSLRTIGVTTSISLVMGFIGAMGGMVVYANSTHASADYTEIPYQGRLELGGTTVDGPKLFRFSLYSAPIPVDETGDGADDSLLWTSSPRTLQVSGGHFAVVLGDINDVERIDDFTMAQDALYLGIEIEGVSLVGRQRLLGVPYAHRGKPTKNFVVDGELRTIDLSVAGNTTTATLNAGTVTAAGSVNAANVTASASVNAANVTASANVNAANLTANTAQINQQLTMNDKPIFFRAANDNNHSLRWDSGTDGPQLSGFGGVSLGTRAGGYSERLRATLSGVSTWGTFDVQGPLLHRNKAVVRDVTVVSCTSSNCPCPNGFLRIDRDLNEGSSGRWIYLCVERTGG